MVEYTPVEAKIIKQIEYYFGDANLQRDKFLLEQIKLDDGWISLDVMLKFNRLSQLTTDKEVIINALKKVVDTLVEVHDDGTKIRRTPDKPIGTITKEYLDERKKRTIYAKGFPIDATLDQMIEFFEKFGPTENILMRKSLTKQFKGSCFVVYKTDASARSFIESAETYLPGQELIRDFKSEYLKKKYELIKNKNKGVIEQESKVEKDEIKKKNEFQMNIVLGTILDLIGFEENTKIFQIKQYLSEFAKVVWIDLENNKARVRFDAEGDAAKVIEALKSSSPDGKICFNEQELQYKILEGDEEKDHWQSLLKIKKDSFNNSKSGKGKRGRGGKNQRPNKREWQSKGQNNWDRNNKRFKNNKGDQKEIVISEEIDKNGKKEETCE